MPMALVHSMGTSGMCKAMPKHPAQVPWQGAGGLGYHSGVMPLAPAQGLSHPPDPILLYPPPRIFK